MVASSGYGHSVADQLGSDPLMRRDPYRTEDMVTRRGNSQVRRAPSSSGLYEVLDLILDKGIVVDAFVRVSLVGIELLTVDLRVVIASVDTYLRYAEGVEKLNLRGDEKSEPRNLPGMVGGGMKARAVSKGADKVGRMLGSGGDDDDDRGDGAGGKAGGSSVAGALSRGVRGVVGRILGDDDDDNQGGKRGDQRRQDGARPVPRREGGGDRKPAGARR